MSAIVGYTTGPNWLNLVGGTQRYPGGNKGYIFLIPRATSVT